MTDRNDGKSCEHKVKWSLHPRISSLLTSSGHMSPRCSHVRRTVVFVWNAWWHTVTEKHPASADFSFKQSFNNWCWMFLSQHSTFYKCIYIIMTYGRFTHINTSAKWICWWRRLCSTVESEWGENTVVCVLKSCSRLRIIWIGRDQIVSCMFLLSVCGTGVWRNSLRHTPSLVSHLFFLI